ncbi:Ribosomal large subunit pseudouridine synthase D [Cystobacter fuscus DSM 2262]|uniref:Pseudouridine synthase n=1 Tax=Cystobacter fuscus (strain ATCC 25194 / DSM 2262 / NBRC 100088 / M29) TaxID=1242864 RepID=S9QXZ7_CYSF2|nr:RluA family pseudouridine synthase [Cystobacter fuscus]EPX61533.1 Ribosomal large subunit pseudouridine synthase D [Cystobacter fuscus DSM 2262]
MSLQKLTVPRDAAGARLDKFLAAHVPGLSLERARGLIEQGHVRIRGKQCQPTRKLWGGEEIELSRPEPRAPARRFVEGPALPVLHDDASWVVVNKPAGLSVEPAGGNVPSVVELVAARLPPFDVEGQALPGVVHRLDRDTSGCLALARTDAAAAALERAFQEKQVDKRYWALVLGETPERERLEGPYGRDPRDPRRFTTKVRSARRAALSYEVRERLRGATLVEVRLETGRTHQIRVQLAEAGHPVLADALYGPDETRTHPAAGAVGRHALHALRLSLPGVSVEAPLPEDFQRALALLRGV